MKKTFLIFTLLSLLAACSAQNANIIDESRIPEGFKKSASGAYVKASDPAVLKNYSAFYVNPISIYRNENGKLSTPDQNEIDMLVKKFRDKLIRELGSRYTPFNQPANDVAIIDINIVDVWSTNSIEAIRPGIIFKESLSGGATMEATFYDSVNHTKLVTIWDSRPGENQGFWNNLTKWGGTEAAFDEWASLLKRNIRDSSF